MPRNSSGVYTLPNAAFIPGTVISATPMNGNFSDIGTMITQSLATTGVSTMSGQLKATGGSASTPGYTFGGSVTDGIYLAGTHQLGFTTNGIQAVTFNSDQSASFAAALTAIGAITAASFSFSSGLSATLPVGVMMDFGGTTAPTGWFLCFGQQLSRTTYSALFAVISTAFGAGDGVTTFNLPDLRGRISAGQDNMGGSAANRIGTVSTDSGTIVGTTLGSTGGSSTHTQTTGETGQHGHGITDPQHTHTIAMQSGTAQGGGGSTPIVNGAGFSTGSSATGITVNQTGAPSAMAWLQPTIIMNKIIYAGHA